MNSKPRLLSGMQPTQPMLHLGNYEGALRKWVSIQEDYQSYFMVADYHALTTLADPNVLASNVIGVARDFMAAGIKNPSAIFRQSDVPEHAELALLLGMLTPLGWLERVPTYKDKKEQVGEEHRVSYGLLGYPVLQASDILLYRADVVPVGRDQAAHLELARELARRFINTYGHVLKDFQPLGLDTPVLPGTDGRKMSKSLGNAIYLGDDEDTTTRKVMSCFTTPSKIKATDPGEPDNCAVCRLLHVYSKDASLQTSECAAGQRGCVKNKRELAEAINAELRPIRERRKSISTADVEDTLRYGAIKAREVAVWSIAEVREAMGLGA